MILFGGEGLRNTKREDNGTSVSEEEVPPDDVRSVVSQRP
jgi:hypothetical protein